MVRTQLSKVAYGAVGQPAISAMRVEATLPLPSLSIPHEAKTDALSPIARMNNPVLLWILCQNISEAFKDVNVPIPLACGANMRRVTLADPALSPAIVTWLGSPPNALIFLLTHRKASIWSKMPAFPGTSSVSNERNPI